MKTEHLTDTELQQYLFDKSSINLEIMDHLKQCPGCKVRAANYRLIAAQVAAQQKPAFDFDLSALVIEQLAPAPQRPPIADRAILWIIVLAALLFALIIYINKGAFTGGLTAVSYHLLYLLAVPLLLIFVFQFNELFKKHQKRMNILNAL